MTYDKHFSTRASPQSERSPGRSDEVQNRAGGFVFKANDIERVKRFLILGSEAPTYYAGARELTKESCEAALRVLQVDGMALLDLVLEVSIEGRAPSNDPALFLLAMASSEGDEDTRKRAFDELLAVARTGTHLFTFLEYRKAFGGWGRGMKRAVQRWYMERTVDSLAYQVIKYRQRSNWTHRDVLRQAHPDPVNDPRRDDLFAYIVNPDVYGKDISIDRLPTLVQGFEVVQRAKSAHGAAALISSFNLPREAVPTEYLNSKEVWEALLYAGKYGMPLGALFRNLGNMSKVGLLTPMSDAAKYINEKITDADALRAARIHPYQAMVAMKTYAEGTGFRGSSSWSPVSSTVDALEAAMEMSFGYIKPSGKRIQLALDVSGSMGWSTIRNSNITAREAAAVMALATARVESEYQIMAFSDQYNPLDLSKRDSFRSALNKTNRLPFGGTDCALPMLHAMGYERSGHSRYERPVKAGSGYSVDAFVIYTDNETWAGTIKPFEALQKYRQSSGIDAKLIVVGMTSNGFTIADPEDDGMLDVVGFDTAAPNVISEFINS